MTEKVKAKSKAKSKSSKTRKKTNLSKLCTQMNKMSVDAVDKEIIKRFKIIIDTSDEDISKSNLEMIINEPSDVEASNYHESLQPYIKHYLFMLKRSNNKKNTEE